MKIAIIAGPHRKISQSAKVANWIGNRLGSLGHQSWILDLGNHKLPVWDDLFGKVESLGIRFGSR